MQEQNPLARKIANNAFFKTVGELSIRLLSFVFIVVVARTLGDKQFGVINFAYSFSLLFVVVVDFGLNPLMVRDSARTPGQTANLFFNLLTIKVLLALLYSLALFIGLQVVAPSAQMKAVTYWLGAFVLLNSFTEFISAVFHGHQKMHLEAMAMVAQKMGLVLFGLTALAYGKGLLGVAQAYTAAGLIGLLLGLLFLSRNRLLQGPWRLDFQFLKQAFHQALPLTLTTLFINIYFRIDMTLLAKMTNQAQVGWYGAAHKCIEVLMVLPAVLVVATFPGFSTLYWQDKARMARAAKKILRLLLMMGLPIAIGALLVGTSLVRLIFGTDYLPAGPALGLLSVALCFIFLNYALSYFLIAAERQAVNAIVSGVAVAVSVGANFVLIPQWGYMGAAVSAAITEAFLFVAYYSMVQRYLFTIPWWKEALKIVGAALIMALVLWPLRFLVPWVTIPVGGLAYGLALWLLRAVGKEDLDLIRKMVKR